MFLFVLVVLELLEIDFCFVISVIVVNVDSMFILMKEIINDVIDNYGINKICYSVILFGV